MKYSFVQLSRLLFTFFIVGTIPAGYSLAQNQIEKSIQVSGEAPAFIENKIAVVKFQVEANGASAAQAEKQIEIDLSKINIPKSSSIIKHKNDYLGATSDPNKLVKGSPIRVITTASIILNEGTPGTLIDLLLNQQNIKILEVSSRPLNRTEALKTAYATAVLNARTKAEYLAKENNITLGEILEISVTEELPPSSIRDQLQNNPDQIDSGGSELRIFANIKFEIKSLLKVN